MKPQRFDLEDFLLTLAFCAGWVGLSLNVFRNDSRSAWLSVGIIFLIPLMRIAAEISKAVQSLIELLESASKRPCQPKRHRNPVRNKK